MKRIIDENNFYIGDALDDEVSEDDVRLIDAPPPQGFYRPKWNGGIAEWEEGESPEEHQAREAELKHIPPTEPEELQMKLDMQSAALAELLLLIGGTL